MDMKYFHKIYVRTALIYLKMMNISIYKHLFNKPRQILNFAVSFFMKELNPEMYEF